MTTSVFISFRKILRFRFFNFSRICFRQKLLSIYSHDKNSMAFKNHPLRKWSGYNKYSTKSSFMDLCQSGNNAYHLIFPELSDSIETLSQKIENRKLHIQSIILKNSRKGHLLES